MARTTRTASRQKPDPPKHSCRDCAHSYDWQNKALDGHLILCRCKLDPKSEFGKWCKFLSDPECDNFKNRPQSAEDHAETN